MRQPSIIALIIMLILLGFNAPCYSVIRAKIDYSIPIDYSKLSESELLDEAEGHFLLSEEKNENGEIPESTSKALLLYTILSNKNPDKFDYQVKLGALYDKVDKDSMAKKCFTKAIGIDNSNPQTYYYLGRFYHRRDMLKRALHYYNQSYSKGFTQNYQILYYMGDIYEKLGDTRSALKYLNEAKAINTNPELENKINRVMSQDEINNEYYTNTRIRK